ncbi:unnamed protein product [Boreogadus saida]
MELRLANYPPRRRKETTFLHTQVHHLARPAEDQLVSADVGGGQPGETPALSTRLTVSARLSEYHCRLSTGRGFMSFMSCPT